MAEPHETLQATMAPAARAFGETDRLYLYILEGDCSALQPLPHGGTLLIGRASEADLQLKDPTVSRRHAQVVVEASQVRLVDLGSQNGTRINGEPVQGSRMLRGGDVISICSATLVLHASTPPQPTRPVLDVDGVRARLIEELERALAYERSVGVVDVELGPTGATAEALRAAADKALSLIDMAGWEGSSHLVAVLPELDAHEVEAAAQALLEALAPLAKEARAGSALAPAHGMDADTLLAAARAATLAAQPGQVLAHSQALHRIQLGERSVLAADPSMVRAFALLQRVARSDLPVLIHGETGTGKENAAWAVHHWSPRAKQPFLPINCAALPESLVESELFGHERGAFSGATSARAGLLESASGGTIFLDEVGELPPSAQAKLLRALDQKRIMRLGEVREREVDMRVVAATHRDLEQEVKAGRFRQDLYFRLSAATVVLPALRDRPRELPLLARTFLEAACERVGRPPMALSAGAMRQLAAHAWPGNVRELKNLMEFCAAAVHEPVLEASHLAERFGGTGAPAQQEGERPVAEDSTRTFRPIAEELRELERRRMLEALEAAGGVQRRAAPLIGMPLRTFVLKLKQYGLAPRVRS